jgi:hypothetical protein
MSKIALSESDRFTEDFQNDSANAILKVVSVVGIPLSAFLGYRILTNSLPEYFLAVIFLILAVTLGAFARKRFSVTQKAIILLAPLILITMFLISNQGLYSQAPLTLVLLIALSSVFRSRVSQPIVAVIVGSLLLYAASLHLTDRISLNDLLSERVLYIRVLTTLSLLLMFGVLIRALVNALYQRSELLTIANIEYQMVVEDLSSTLDELMLLRETINVCAKCRKVKRKTDSDGLETWYSLEEYVHENTNTDVSHGYCQQCFDEDVSKI